MRKGRLYSILGSGNWGLSWICKGKVTEVPVQIWWCSKRCIQSLGSWYLALTFQTWPQGQLGTWWTSGTSDYSREQRRHCSNSAYSCVVPTAEHSLSLFRASWQTGAHQTCEPYIDSGASGYRCGFKVELLLMHILFLLLMHDPLLWWEFEPHMLKCSVVSETTPGVSAMATLYSG